MKTITMMAVVAMAFCSGCKNDTEHIYSDTSKTNSQVRYLCVGMEMSKRFGACPGCAVDARNMTSLLSGRFGYPGDTLISDQATKSAVVSKLMEGIVNTPTNGLFLFCYSGHGGQEYLGGKEPDGADRQDEYLCLYDTYMKDDEIWDIINKCKGRVFLYFDACHSATMYRSVASDNLVRISEDKDVAIALGIDNMVMSSGFSFKPENFVTANALSADGDSNSLRMMCWSGCKEAEYSYGAANGGVMTRALMRNWAKGFSYSLLWGRMCRDINKEQPGQHPINTIIGQWPTLGEAFK